MASPAPPPELSRAREEFGVSVEAMPPRRTPVSPYGPSNEQARAEVEAIGHTPLTLDQIAYLFDVTRKTVDNEWRSKAHLKVDPKLRFPEETWPGPAWSFAVIKEWADASGRKMKRRLPRQWPPRAT